MSPRISVIVPSYNSAKFVAEAIDSILAQTLPPFEVVVVNDGSTDDTEEVLRAFEGRIRHIRQANGGLPNARNRGIRESRGNLIAFLDADDVWLPDMLEKLWNGLRDHPEAGLAHSSWYFWNDETGKKTVPAQSNQANDTQTRSPEHQPEEQKRDFRSNYRNMFFQNRFIVCAALVKRECLDRVGLFDESFRACEDYDLFLRLARRYEFTHVDEPLALYRRHSSNMSKDNSLMLKYGLRVRQKALREDPKLRELAGGRRVDALMHHEAFLLGYLLHDAGRGKEAREWFRVALAHRPWRVYARYLYLANLLPTPWVRGLRRLKSRLPRRPASNVVDRSPDPRGASRTSTQNISSQ